MSNAQHCSDQGGINQERFGRVGDPDVRFYDILIRYFDKADGEDLGWEMVTQAGRPNVGVWHRLARGVRKEREEKFPGLYIETYSQDNSAYRKFEQGELPIVNFANLVAVYGVNPRS